MVGGEASGVVAPSKTVQGAENGKPDNSINKKKIFFAIQILKLSSQIEVTSINTRNLKFVIFSYRQPV